MNRYDLTDFEWSVIETLLPNKPRRVPRVDDRRVLNGIMWVLRFGARWRDQPERYKPYTTCYNRFNRWRKKAIWDRVGVHTGIDNGHCCWRPPLSRRQVIHNGWADRWMCPWTSSSP